MLTLLHKCTKYVVNMSLFAVLMPVYEGDSSRFLKQNLHPQRYTHSALMIIIDLHAYFSHIKSFVIGSGGI